METELFGKVENSIIKVGERKLQNVRLTEEINERYLEKFEPSSLKWI